MNKTDFIKKLSKELNFDLEKTNIVNDILENNFIIGKNNKEKMIKQLCDKLKINEKDANKIYDKAMEIVAKEIKNKIKNKFINQ